MLLHLLGLHGCWAWACSPEACLPRALARESQVKAAYRSRARACHPDTNPGPNADPEAFRRLSRAYDEVLRLVERDRF